MAILMVKNFNDDLKDQLKAQAEKEERTLRVIVERAIRLYISEARKLEKEV